MLNIANILPISLPQKSKGLHNEWQVQAYQVFESLELTKKDLPNLFRFYKTFWKGYARQISTAYSFAYDYEGNIPKLKLFYWKFNQLKK